MSRDNIHFIGIGGIGVSSLARYYRAMGFLVSGSDIAESELTQELAREGIQIVVGAHAKKNIPLGTTKVIYTAALNPKNTELREAKRQKIPSLSYAQALGGLTKEYKTITISGSHGKSTTTALIALILQEGYLDPTVIIGTKLKEFGNSNFRSGKSHYLVLEADEWNKSFLNYFPRVAVITNIDAEHLDTYKNINDVKKTFLAYLKKVPKKGVVIANRDDANLHDVATKSKKKVIWYSIKDPEAAVIRHHLKIPGEHNLSNALAALKTARFLGISENIIIKALSHYRGAWRRFEFQGLVKGANIYSDYAHHPREIVSTIAAARSKFPLQRVWCVFQPHQHERLLHLWNDFVNAFDMADRIVLLPVYEVAGREKNGTKKLVNSRKLSKELLKHGKNVVYCASPTSAKKVINEQVKKGDIVLVMGAGDIYKLALELIQTKKRVTA